MFKKQILVLAVLASIGGVAQADNMASSTAPVDKRFYVAPFGTFITTGSGKADNGWGGGLAIGKMIDQHFNVEVKGFYDNAGFDGQTYTDVGGLPVGRNVGGDWNLAGATVDLQYFLNRNKFAPYGVLALGGMNSDVTAKYISPLNGLNASRSRNAPALVAEAGVGFTYEVTDNFLLRSDVRYRFSDAFGASERFNNIAGSLDNGASANRANHDMTVNVGFVIPFGSKPKAAPPVEVAAPEPVYIAPAPYVAPPVYLPKKQERE